ncbi:ATP-grasp domain-containing protein [Photobacterium arenosum]|uniref:ATP-grasp domain-containing protein n=1 Tax=Photobacterium arenosum TaxID=2774143 RepID=UPI002889D656|nr:ATP-grasp domain-containing protein [Photobacterium arenosum]
MRSKVLIVNPASSGKMIRPKLQANNIQCDVCFYSEHDPKGMLDTINIENYDNNVSHFKIDALQNEKYDAVIAGSELGVELADKLASELALPGNSPLTTGLRRNKNEMQDALKEHGLAYIQTFLVDMDGKGLNELHEIKCKKYIIKPVNSAGSENVYFCNSRDDVINKISSLPWGKINSTGKINDQFLVQEFIEGEEYVLDLIVNGDQITLVAICKYVKGQSGNNPFVYNRLELLDPYDAGLATIREYAVAATRALDIRYGLVHMELMLSPAKGPVMIEAATRIHGGVAPSLFESCYSPSLLDTIASLVSEHRVPELDSKLVKQGRVYFHVNKHAAKFSGVDTISDSKLKRIPSLIDYFVTVKEGQVLPATEDLFTCPCLVWLANDNTFDLESDIKEVEHVLNGVFNKELVSA